MTFCERKGVPVEQAPDYDPQHIQYAYSGGAVKKKKKEGKKKISFWEGTNGAIPQSPFNALAIDLARERGRALWICEGEKDTMTMWEAGEMAIGIPSASSDKVLNGVSLVGIPKVIIACDNDEAGRKATGKILSRFPFARYVKWPEDKGKGYDVADHKKKNPGGFIEDLKGWAVDADPFEPLTKHLRDKFDRDQARDPGRLLGYELTRFKTLAKNIDGIQQGFYVVGARTNAGKTAFLCNLTLDLLDSNEDLRGIYFSLDDSRDVILNRLLSIKTSIPLNQVQRPQQRDRHTQMLKEGYAYLTDLAKDKRLYIRDTSDIQDIDDLEREIRRRMDRKLFVVIDALYNLDVGLIGDQRKENIERANRLKAIATTYSIPVVCTAELRKRESKDVEKPPTIDDIMETGKFAYNADLVLMLYPESWDAYNGDDEPVLKMKYEKNKLSHYRGTQELRFKKIESKLEEHEQMGD